MVEVSLVDRFAEVIFIALHETKIKGFDFFIPKVVGMNFISDDNMDVFSAFSV